MSSFSGDAAVPHDSRLAQLDRWLNGLFGARDFSVTTASADASFRRYFRVTRAAQSWIAMDAPPDKEDMEPYIRIAAMLVDVGVNAPRVLERNQAEGFLLNTDLGSLTYLMHLDAGADADRAVPRCHRGAGRIQAHGQAHASQSAAVRRRPVAS